MHQAHARAASGPNNPEALIVSLIASREQELGPGGQATGPVADETSMLPPGEAEPVLPKLGKDDGMPGPHENASSMPMIPASAGLLGTSPAAAPLGPPPDGINVPPDPAAAARKAKLLADLVPQAVKQMQRLGSSHRDAEDESPPHLHMELTLQPKDLVAAGDDASPNGQAAPSLNGPPLPNSSQPGLMKGAAVSGPAPHAAEDEDPPISDVDSDATHSAHEDDDDMDIDNGILDAARKGANVKDAASLAALYSHMPSAAPLISQRRNGLGSLDADSAYTSIMAMLKEKRGTVPKRGGAPARPPAGQLQATAAHNLIAGLLRENTDPAEVCRCPQMSPSFDHH